MGVIIALEVVIILLQIAIFVLHRRTKYRVENECYTDYRHNNVVLRVYKAEFEYQAVGNLRSKILDQGNLNAYYRWTLMEL